MQTEMDVALEMCLKLYEKARLDLSNSQFQVLSDIDFEPGLTTVVAGAGAGKTRTLSFIVQKALMQDAVTGVSLLASTKAAKCEAYERASKLYNELELADEIFSPLNVNRVRTIHSIALMHAKERDAAEGGAGVSVVGKSTILDLIKNFIDEAHEQWENTSEPDEDAAAPTAAEVGLKDVIANMSQHDAAQLLYNVRSERLKNCKLVADRSLGKTAYKVLKNLQLAMECDATTGQKLSDFDLMIYELAESGAPLVCEGEVLIIDEAQDMSFCQVKVVLNTLLANACVVALGDDSQGIFQFSGALSNTIQELERMSKKHGMDTIQFRLMQNHRSSDEIVLASEAFLPFQDTEFRKDIRGNGSKSTPEAMLCTSPHAIVAKILELVQSKTCSPGEIVILRHKTFGWNDELVKCLDAEAFRRGVAMPVSILGQDVASTIEMKAACIIQMAVGLENFVDSPNDGIQTVRAFLRGLRGSRGAPPNAMKAIGVVWERLGCDPSVLFSHHAAKLLAEFSMIEDADSESTVPPKRRKTTPADGGQSQKWRNFKETIRTAASAIKQVRERIESIKKGELPLRPMSVESNGQQQLLFSSKPFGVSRHLLPTMNYALGGLAFIIIRDLVDHKFSDADSHSLQRLVDAYDVPLPADATPHSVDDQLVAQTCSLVSELIDTETKGKIVFSTIHRFKGRERPCAILIDIKRPFSVPDAARKAALSCSHDDTCNNRDGGEICHCDGYLAGIERMKNADISEKLRLYYVGASRAKSHLFLAFSEKFEKLDILRPNCPFIANRWYACKTNTFR